MNGKHSHRPGIGAGVMLLRDGKCLLGRRKGSRGAACYGWSGGGLILGESPAECAIRETKEETGIVVRSMRLLCVSSFFIDSEHLIDLSFVSDTFDGEATVTEPDKVESWDWYDLDSLPTPLYTPVELGIRSFFSGLMYNEKY